jgi:hypothetical protein
VCGQRIAVSLQSGVAARMGSAFDQRQAKLRRSLDDPFRLLEVRNTRELHQDAIVAAIPCDDGLGHAKCIDAPFDDLHGLLDRLAPLRGIDVIERDAQDQLDAARQIQAERNRLLDRMNRPDGQRDDRRNDEDSESTTHDHSPVHTRRHLADIPSA